VKPDIATPDGTDIFIYEVTIMGLNYPVINEGFVPAYQASSAPYVTSSMISLGEVHVIEFPQVTRFFNVQNVSATTGSEVAVAFTQRGLDPVVANYFTVGQGVAFRDEIKTTRLFISCSLGGPARYQVVAGLTNIPATQFLLVTGSNGHAGVG
jgi:hypothetical protein